VPFPLPSRSRPDCGAHGMPADEARAGCSVGNARKTRERWNAAGGHPHFGVRRVLGCKLRALRSPGARDPRCSGMVSGHGGGRGLLHACVDASGTAEGWKHGRGPSAFFGRYLSRHPRPEPSSDAYRKRTGAGLHERPMRDLAKLGPARRPGFLQRLVRGDGSRDRASDVAGMVGCGALGRERCSRKNADGPLPGFHPPAVPDVLREARCAPPRRTRRTRCRPR
jgi:hypothetical protein